MISVWVAVAVAAIALLLGWLIGQQQRYAKGVAQGRRATEREHGWPSPPEPGGHRRRWAWRNRKQPEPSGLVEKSFTPAERARNPLR